MNPIDPQLSTTGINTSLDQATRLQRENDLKEATQGFEAIFLNSIMKNMRQTLPGNSLFKDNNASQIYQSMYDQYLTEDISKGNQKSIGLKELLYDELKSKI